MKSVLESVIVNIASRRPDVTSSILDRCLHSVRKHLGMDVAFISEFADGRRRFLHVDAESSDCPIHVGGSDPLEESYCQRVADGRLPELMLDACVNAEALTLAATRALPVGSHLSVPIVLSDGSIFGTFCCFSYSPDLTLNGRDLSMMRAFAEMVAAQLDTERAERNRQKLIRDRVMNVLEDDGLSIVYQPIFNNDMLIGFESLSRFASDAWRTPDIWFREAASVGLGVMLEAKAIRSALQGLSALPEPLYLSVNASPDMIVNGNLASLLAGVPMHRIVVEVTEHHATEDYEALASVIRPMQSRGLRVAIDDAGAGYASFRHVLNLSPDIIKLDISITRGIDADQSRRALAAALCTFASATSCKIIAEGVESSSELAALKELGITHAQGFYLGRPCPLPQARELAAVSDEQLVTAAGTREKRRAVRRR